MKQFERRIGGILVVMSLAAGSVGAQAPDPGPILRNASRVYRGLRSLRADFEQVISDRMLDTLTSRGQLLQVGDAQLLMRFSDPDGDLILSDGNHVWFYLPSSTPGQVIRIVVPSDPVYGPNMLARVLDRPDERYLNTYLRTESINGRSLDVIEMIPQSDSPPFRRATVWLDRGDALPRKIVLVEPGGQVRTVALSRLRTNVPIPDGTFTFTVPRGVRVIDQ